MANPAKVIVFLALLGGLGVCYGQEAPKWTHVYVKFPYPCDEDVFLRQLKKEEVNFEEGKRIQEHDGPFPVFQEFILDINSIPKFEVVLQRIQLKKFDYSKAMNEYIQIGLPTTDTRVQDKLKDVGIHIQEIKNGRNKWITTYTVEVSLFPQVKDIATSLSVCNYEYKRTRLCRKVVSYKNEAAEAEVLEKLKKYFVPVEEGSRSSTGDTVGTFLQEYFFEPNLLYDFNLAVGENTILEDK